MKLVTPAPDPDMVKAMQGLLEKAQSGELIGFAGVAWCRGDSDPDLHIGGLLNPLATHGALRALGFLLDEVTE